MMPCILWTGAVQSAGYGNRKVGGKWMLAHRYAYLQIHGSIPDGYEVDHLCENKLCINAEHLEAVPPVVNTRRASRGNAAKTHCKHGHELSDDNVYRRPDRPHTRMCRICRSEAMARSRAKPDQREKARIRSQQWRDTKRAAS